MVTSFLEPEAGINEKIERTRARMNHLADELGYVHPKVLFVSQQLDLLLLEFYALTAGKHRLSFNIGSQTAYG